MILDQFGRPYQTKKTPERRSLAVAPLTDAWREYVTSGLTPERLAAIFREADAGDIRRQAELFDQIEEKDAHILGEISKRKNSILTVDFKLSPASEDKRDIKVAEFVQDFFDNAADFDDVLVSLQDGVGKGFACLEIDWDASEGQALPQAFEFIEQKRFLFMDSSGILNKTPRLITDEQPMGVEIPAWKVLFHRYGGKSGHPTRSGIFRVCTWLYLFKNYSIKDWVIFCEVYGMPLRLGKYSPGASKEDKEALIHAISTLGTDAAGIISRSTEIEFIETIKGKATGDLYETLAKFCNREMSKAILGQTLSAEVGDKGSYAASKTHNEVRLDLLKADARAIAATIRNQLIRPIVGFNFGWDTSLPDFKPIFEERDDLGKKANWVCQLLDRGVEMPLSYIRKQFKIPEPKDGEETVGRRAPETAILASTKAKVGKAVSGARDSLEPYTQKAVSEAGPLLEGLLQPVRELVMSASSLEEVRDKLLDMYADLDPLELGNLMEQALSLAELLGRFEVLQGE